MIPEALSAEGQESGAECRQQFAVVIMIRQSIRADCTVKQPLLAPLHDVSVDIEESRRIWPERANRDKL